MMDLLCNSRACLVPVVTPDIERALVRAFSYQHRQYIRGKEAWRKFGRASGQEFSWKTFVRKEPDGTLSVPAGFAEKTQKILTELGHQAAIRYLEIPNLKPDWDHLKSRIQFRPTQEETLRMLLDKPFGGLEASPGYGKGFLIYCICALNPTAKVDITADSVVVCRQLYDYLEPFIPGIGFVGDGTKQKGSQITIYVLDSLHHSDGNADILVVDEVHTAVSNKASQKFSQYRKARRYWFSATPEGRADNTDLRVEALFGPTRRVITYPECVALGLVVNIRVRWIDVMMDYNPIERTTDPTEKARFGIWRNDFRNRLLSREILATPEQDQTLCLVSKVEHLAHMAQYLPGFQVAFGAGDSSIEEARHWAQMGKLPLDCLEDRKRKNKEMRVDFTNGKLRKVLVTSIWDTGANFPELSDIFRLDPFDGGYIKDIQAPGRLSRLFEDKLYASLNDTVDRFDQGLYDKARRKRPNYKSQGWDEHGWVEKDQ